MPSNRGRDQRIRSKKGEQIGDEERTDIRLGLVIWIGKEKEGMERTQ